MSTAPAVLGRLSVGVGSGLAVYIQPMLLIAVAAALVLVIVLIAVVALIAVLSQDGARRADARAVLKVLSALRSSRPTGGRSSQSLTRW